MKKILSVLLISAFLISFLPCTDVHAKAGTITALYDDDTEVPDDPDDLYDYDDREDMVEEQAEPESTEVKKPKKKRNGGRKKKRVLCILFNLSFLGRAPSSSIKALNN